jgi:hypothetical protein
VDDLFWEEEFGDKPKRGGKYTRLPREPRQPGARRGVDRESIIAKYKIMQVQVQDRNGNMYTIKKRVSNIDPALPTYVRIPPRPISMAWAHKIRPLSSIPLPAVPLGSNYHEVNSILSTDLTQYGTDFSAVYMDPPFLLPGEAPCSGKISIEDFVS